MNTKTALRYALEYLGKAQVEGLLEDCVIPLSKILPKLQAAYDASEPVHLQEEKGGRCVMDEHTRKGFFECLCNFMSGHEGLTPEDMIAELKDCGFIVRSFVPLSEVQKQLKPNSRPFNIPSSVTINTDGYEIVTLSTLRKGDVFLDLHGKEWMFIEKKRSLVHVKSVAEGKPGHFVKHVDVRLPKRGDSYEVLPGQFRSFDRYPNGRLK